MWLPTKETTPTQLTQVDPALAPPRNVLQEIRVPTEPLLHPFQAHGGRRGMDGRGEGRAGQRTLLFPPEFGHLSAWSMEEHLYWQEEQLGLPLKPSLGFPTELRQTALGGRRPLRFPLHPFSQPSRL